MNDTASNKKTTAYRIDRETFKLVQKLMGEADCKSFQEFGDKATLGRLSKGFSFSAEQRVQTLVFVLICKACLSE